MKRKLKDAWQLFVLPYKMLFETIGHYIRVADDYEITLRRLLKNYHRNRPRWIIENYQFDPVTCRDSYQENCRVYLDEYEEQKEIRKEWWQCYHPKALYVYSSEFVSYLDKTILNGLGFKLILDNKDNYDSYTKLLLHCEGNNNWQIISDTNDFEFEDKGFTTEISCGYFHPNSFRKKEWIEEALYRKEVYDASHGKGACLHIIQEGKPTEKYAIYDHFENRFMRKN